MLLDGLGADSPFYLPVSVTGVAFERWFRDAAVRGPDEASFRGRVAALGGRCQGGRLHLGIPRRPHLARADAHGRSQPCPGDGSGGRRPRHHTRRTCSRGRAGFSAATHLGPRRTSASRLCGRCAVPPRRAAWRWSTCCWHTGRTRHGSASDAGSFIPSLLRCLPAVARRSTPQARGSVPAARETRVARTIRSMSAPSCTTVPARTIVVPATQKVRPASGSQRDSAALRRQGRLPADHRGTHRPRSRPRRPRQSRPHAA